MHAIVALLIHQMLSQTDARYEVFQDPRFERGFTLTAASHPAPRVELGTLQTTAEPAKEAPAWRMPQWATRYLLEPGPCRPGGDSAWTIENPGKRAEVRRKPGAPVGLLLEVRGGAEYGEHLRAPGEAWPHLLIEQIFNDPVRLASLKSLSFGLEMRIPRCAPVASMAGKLDRGLHTAQISAFWTLHNLTPESADYRDMIWFGIPLFDARHEIPPPHYALDTGKADASAKFITLLDGRRFWQQPTGDGAWHRLDADLLFLMREALAIAQQHGHLKSTRFEDLAFTSFNLGWEVTGPYDATLEVANLGMKAERD